MNKEKLIAVQEDLLNEVVWYQPPEKETEYYSTSFGAQTMGEMLAFMYLHNPAAIEQRLLDYQGSLYFFQEFFHGLDILTHRKLSIAKLTLDRWMKNPKLASLMEIHYYEIHKYFQVVDIDFCLKAGQRLYYKGAVIRTATLTDEWIEKFLKKNPGEIQMTGLLENPKCPAFVLLKYASQPNSFLGSKARSILEKRGGQS